MNHCVLIAEDNAEIASLVKLHLNDICCSADIAADGDMALSMFAKKQYELVILDLMLPELSGTEVCKRIREENKLIPIIMLTSKSTEIDRVLGLEIGADDYVTKPFSIPELMARVKAQFRRLDVLKTPQQQSNIKFGQLSIHIEKRQVVLRDERLDLTAKEFDLLLYFAKHPGRVFSRMELLSQVWGYQYEGYEHTVNSHINRLRAKIESDPAKPQYILTVWGVGYKFNEECS